MFLEAMAAGKPIVAHDAAAVPEVVRHGLLVEPENDDALAEAIERLLWGFELRTSLAEQGRRDMEISICDVWLRRFMEIVSSGPREARGDSK